MVGIVMAAARHFAEHCSGGSRAAHGAVSPSTARHCSLAALTLAQLGR